MSVREETRDALLAAIRDRIGHTERVDHLRLLAEAYALVVKGTSRARESCK